MPRPLADRMERLQKKFKNRLKEMKKAGLCGTEGYEILAWVTNSIDGTLSAERSDGNHRNPGNPGNPVRKRRGLHAGQEVVLMGYIALPENMGCEFHEDGRCLIGHDMTFCNTNCAYASNSPCSTPPYGSRYMRGGRL